MHSVTFSNCADERVVVLDLFVLEMLVRVSYRGDTGVEDRQLAAGVRRVPCRQRPAPLQVDRDKEGD